MKINASAEYSLKFGSRKIAIKKSQFWFSQDGTIKKIEKSLASSVEPMKILSEQFSVWGIERIKFDEQQNIRSVTTGAFGKFMHVSVSDDEIKEIGATTLNFDASGNPIFLREGNMGYELPSLSHMTK